MDQEPILVSATQDEAAPDHTPHALHASTATTVAVVPLSEGHALPCCTGRLGPYPASMQGPTTADLFAALHDLQASMHSMQAAQQRMHTGIASLQHNMDDMHRHLITLDRRLTQTREQADELDNSNFNAHVRITDTAAQLRELGRTVQDLQDRHAQLSTNQVQLSVELGTHCTSLVHTFSISSD